MAREQHSWTGFDVEKAFVRLCEISNGKVASTKDLYLTKQHNRKCAVHHSRCNSKIEVTVFTIYFQEIDLNKATPDDLNFIAPFHIRARRNDYIHAFVAFFTVEFSACHKRTGFSTGNNKVL